MPGDTEGAGTEEVGSRVSALEQVAPGAPRTGGASGRTSVVVGDRPATVEATVRRVSCAEVEVLAVATDGDQLVASFRRLRPDVVLVGWSMPRLNGLELLDRVLEIDPAACVVFMSAHADPPAVRQCLNAGASGWLLESAAPGRLSEGVRAAARGLVVLDTNTSRRVTEPEDAGRGWTAPPPDGRLSARERAVLRLVAEGCTNPVIADRLGIRLATVKTHLARITMKLGVRGRLAAAREAGALGLLYDPQVGSPPDVGALSAPGRVTPARAR